MKTTLFLFAAFCLTATAFSQNHPIGHTTITFNDPDRTGGYGSGGGPGRQIQSEIYYPAVSAGQDTPAASGAYPVIVFGHGFVMSWDAYENLWEEFVPRGYIMVFPRTEGNLFGTDHQEFGWDLQLLVTEMQLQGSDPNSILYESVSEETALMGHSMGGGASFLAADSLCVNGNTNLKTLVGLAPAESTSNGVSSIASANQVTVPSIVLSGVQDGVTPPADHHIPMYQALGSSCKSLINITGGAHCYFAEPNGNCDFGESTSSSGISISRTEQHEVTFDFVNLWLDYTLKYNCNEFSTFNDSLNNSTRVTFEQVCSGSLVIETEETIAICQGDEFTFPDGTTSSTSTIHTSNLTSVNGCDSLHTIELEVSPLDDEISVNNGILTASQIGGTYQWIDCQTNTPILNATNQSFEPNTSGDYAVEITIGSCTGTSSCLTIEVLSLDEEKEINFVKLFPNPNDGSFEINILEPATINFYNAQGQEVHIESITQNNQRINLDQNPGVYFWRLTTKQGHSESGKVIIQ